jgi:hypothetical protein
MYTVDEIKYMATINTIQSAAANPIPGFRVDINGWTIMCLYIRSPVDSAYDRYDRYVRQCVSESEVQRVLDYAATPAVDPGNTQSIARL